MQCPVCKGEMYDNRENKKNPKAPDYRCKDKECKFQLDPETKEYISSEYGTGVWLPRTPPTPKPQTNPSTQSSTPKSNDMQIKSMLLSYAKDIVVAEINQGTTPPVPALETLSIYKKFLEEICSK